MSRLPKVGGDDGNWGSILNDYLSQSLEADGKLKPQALEDAGVARDNNVLHRSGNETVDGIKTFTNSPQVPLPVTDEEVANKQYVDESTQGGVSDATSTEKGILQLANDLSGTAESPIARASALRTATTDVAIATATAPAAGQFLRASGSTTASWQALPRTFGWYVEGVLFAGQAQGPLYQLDADVTILGFSVNCKIAPVTTGAVFDVQVSDEPDGVFTSIFSDLPTIAPTELVGSGETLSVTTLTAGQFIRLNIDHAGGTAAQGLTAQLRMETR